MTALGTVEPDSVENLVHDFSDKLGEGQSVIGDANSTKKLLSKVLDPDKVSLIMEEIGGPSGRNTWEKLNNINEEVLASFLRNEYPQTAALVLSKMRASQAARVISVLPEEFALDVMQRMLTMEPVKREIVSDIERTLQQEFMSNLASSNEVDSFEMMAEVFNNFDRNTESKYMDLLDTNDPASAEKIRDLMFTFDDLIKIDNAGIQAVLRAADKEKLGAALKGANDKIRELFFNNMSERAAKILREDMENMGPIRIKDVDEAQMSIVLTAKELADSGEIIIPDGDESEEEMVY
jgi:flagellar motor switch protein FliG